MCTKYSVKSYRGSVFNMVTSNPTKSQSKKYLKNLLISGTKKALRINVMKICNANYSCGKKSWLFYFPSRQNLRFYTNKLKIIVDFSFLLCTSVHYDIREKSLFKINMALCPKTLFSTFLGIFILSTFFQILQMDHQKCSLKKVFGNKVLNFGAKSPMENKSLM